MLKPTTLYLGEKAKQLLIELARENGMSPKYFFTKIILREARNEAASLSAEKLKRRLVLIDEVNDELMEFIKNPPKTEIDNREYSTNPKAIYMKVWKAHERLESKGWSAEEIHEYCLEMYGIDYPVKRTPTKSPKRNPDWVGGGAYAKKIKEAKEASKELNERDNKE